MFILNKFAICICAIVGFSESKFVDTLTKCSIDDDVCVANLISTSLQAIYKTGIPEIGFPSLEPLKLENMTITILDLINLEIYEGEATGLKNCEINSYKIGIEKKHSEANVTCNNFVSNVKYSLSGSSPVVNTLFGGENIHGEGNAKVEIEKIRIIINFNFDVEKNKDDDITFNWIFDKTRYDYELLGKVAFAADNIFVGKKNASQQVVEFLNGNSNFVMTTFGKAFFEKSMEIIHFHISKFFQAVPAKYYIIEDLSKYVKN